MVGIKLGFFFFFNFFFFYLFIGCVGSSFMCEGFLQLRQAGTTLHRGARASVVVAHGLGSCGSRALERRLSSCGARA